VFGCFGAGFDFLATIGLSSNDQAQKGLALASFFTWDGG
jgi:hypothetical protein